MIVQRVDGPPEREGTTRVADSARRLRVGPERPPLSSDLREIWEYRELLYFLVWRDIKVRYKQTVLGAAWAIVQPFMTMVVFTVFFGKLAGVPSDGMPYALFAYTALVPWMFFANAIAQAANSLVGNTTLVTKIYVPRLIVPIAAVLAGAVDFALAFAMLIGIVAYYGMWPGAAVAWLPLLCVLLLAVTLGAGIWLSALTVEFRDVRYALPFGIQFWLFATPIAYPSTLLGEPWRTLYGLNPMAGVVEGFRMALAGGGQGALPMVGMSSAVALATLAAALWYFRRHEARFADVV